LGFIYYGLKDKAWIKPITVALFTLAMFIINGEDYTVQDTAIVTLGLLLFVYSTA